MVDPPERRGRLRQALVGAFRLMVAGGNGPDRGPRRAGPWAGNPAEAERRYGAYWHGTENSLFSVRVGPDGSFRFDGLNPAHEARTGLRAADICGRRPEEVLSPETAAVVTGHYRACVESGHPISYSEALDLPLGRRHWRTNLTPLRNRTGDIETLLGSCEDITEQVIAQAALAEGEERFRRVAELVPDILFTAALDGGPDYLSPAFFAYTGVAHTTNGRAALEVIHPDDLPGIAPDIEKARRQPVETKARLRRHDGVYRWFLIRMGVGRGANGDQLFGMAADIDDVTRSSEQISALNRRLTSVLSSISDCYYTVDRDWRMTSVNPRAVEWFGRPESDLLAEDSSQRIAFKPDLKEAIEAAFESGRSTHLERTSQFRPGNWIELHVYPSTEGASVFFRDITERWQAQAAREEAMDLLQGSLDAMSAEIALLDETGNIVAVNQAWRASGAGGETVAHGIGAPYLEICRRMIQKLDEAKVARGLRALLAGQQRTFSLAYILTTPEEIRWRHLRINRFEHGQSVRLIAMHEDVTEIARAQAALRETSNRLLSVQEDERGRIAVELHDSTSQHLVALGLGVARLRRTLDSETDAEPVLDDMAGSIGEALKEIRVLSYLLNPPNLERDGLALTARRFVDGFGGRTGLHTLFRAEGDLDGLDPVFQRAAFRVIQEALSNVHRHAKAVGAEVDLTVRGHQLMLRIADDGCGIGDLDIDLASPVQLGVGIPGMRARVTQLGGTLTLCGDSGGTLVEAVIPLRRRPSLELSRRSRASRSFAPTGSPERPGAIG
jgi:PAS domain S-box-containing protein